MGLERIVLMKKIKLCLLVCPGSVVVTLSNCKSLKTPSFSTRMNDIWMWLPTSLNGCYVILRLLLVRLYK